MAIYDPRDTMAYQSSRVACVGRDMSHVKLSQLTNKITAYMQSHSASVSPDAEALAFYGMNHGMALISAKYAPYEPMSEIDLAFANRYHEMVVPMAVRAFYYLVLICVREARHNHNLKKHGNEAKMTKLFGPTITQFFLDNYSEDTIHTKLLNNPPAAPIGKFFEAVRWQFNEVEWHTSSYGGKKWGNVADCLYRFVMGEYSAEMMLDTNWTLAHNGGPIFNKGHLYTMYSGELTTWLDVQRSGQIPQLVVEGGCQDFASEQLKKAMVWLCKEFNLGNHVDWWTVEALGALKTYPQKKEAQLKKYGPSALATEMEKQAAAKAKAQQEAKELEEKLKTEKFNKTKYLVMPGVVVNKVEPKREAA